MSDIQLGVDGPIPPFDTGCISLMATKKSLREAISNLPSGRGETKVNRCLLNPQLSCASLFLSAHNTKVKKRQEQNLM